MFVSSVFESLYGLEQYFTPLAEMLLKGGVLFLAAIALTCCFRKRSASVKHFVWMSGFCMLTTMPISQALTPSWLPFPLPRPFEQANVGLGIDAITSSEFVATSVTDVPVAVPIPVDSVVNEPVPEKTLAAIPSVSNEFTVVPASRLLSIVQWKPLFVLVWLIGLVLLLVRLVLSYLRLSVWRRCRPETDDRVETVASEVCKRLEIRSRPTIVRGTTSSAPMTWGILSPRILVPPTMTSWPTDQLRTVLLHEHLHVVRRDPLKQLVVQVICAVHWCNPLAWLAASRVGEERERSCDDLALGLGSNPCDYAKHLVCTASGFPQSAPALAMASPIGLERRVRAVLDQERERAAPSRKMAAVLSAGMLATMLLLVVMRPRNVHANPSPIETAVSVESPEESQVTPPRNQTPLFQNVDFENAPTTRVSDATDFFTQIPPGSGNYEAIDQTWIIPSDDLAANRASAIYFRPDIGKYLIQKDPAASSVLTYYGPFDGNPFLKLGLADFFLDQLRQPDKRLREEARRILAEAEAANFSPELTARLRFALNTVSTDKATAPGSASQVDAITAPTPKVSNEFEIALPANTDSTTKFPTFSATAKSGITFFLDLENGRLVEIDLQKPHDEQDKGGFDVMVTPLDTHCGVGFARTAHLVSGPHTAGSIPHALALGIDNWNTPMRTELIQVKPGQYFLGRTKHGHLAVAEVNMQEETTEIRWSLLVVENQAPKVVPFDNLLSVRTQDAKLSTCAMHPQIRRPNAGKCPICAMDLVPVRENPQSNLRSAQDTDGPVFEVVNEFIERLRQGKEKNTDGVMGWEHVWELTTRKRGWGMDLRKLCQNYSFVAGVQIGDANHMVVLTEAIKGTYPEPVVCVFDLVRQDSHWRIDKEEVLPEKQAWALVNGFSRAPSVAFVVHPSNIVGKYQNIGNRNYTFSRDGTYSERSFGNASSSVDEGTWKLKGNKLLVKTRNGTQQSQIVRIFQDGFTTEGAEGREIGHWRVAQE